MRRFIAFAIILVTIFSIAPSTLADTDPVLDAFCGTYRGSYYANQGHTGLTLRVYKDEADAYKAEFKFYSVPENPSVPSGLYLCDVSYNETDNTYYVDGIEWVEHPATYSFVDLSGTISEDYVYSGDVIYSGSKKYTFELVKQIDDNAPSSWAEITVSQAIESGLVPLELQKDYQYQITRAEFSRLAMALVVLKTNRSINQLLEDNGVSINESTFRDTSDSFVLAANALGIVKGYGNGLFGPDDYITREQSAVLLTTIAKFLALPEPAVSAVSYNDRNSFSSWAADSIDYISSVRDLQTDAPVMQGSGNYFDPKGFYNNEQAFITVYKLYLAFPN